jgi:hypothetical protein
MGAVRSYTGSVIAINNSSTVGPVFNSSGYFYIELFKYTNNDYSPVSIQYNPSPSGGTYTWPMSSNGNYAFYFRNERYDYWSSSNCVLYSY